MRSRPAPHARSHWAQNVLYRTVLVLSVHRRGARLPGRLIVAAIHDAQQRRASRCADARGQRRIAIADALCFITEPVERATVLAHDGYDPLGSTPRDIEDILVRRLRQRAEHERSRRRAVASDVDPIERERMEVQIQP